MNKVGKLLCAGCVGAASMYFFDPDRGKRRRALLLDRVKHLGRVAGDCAGKTRRDVSNHLRGLVAELESPFKAGEVTDDILAARVRSKLGHLVSHPGAIDVSAVDGKVILAGPIFTSEEHHLLESVIAIRGVKNIENELELHESAENIPALQGDGRRPRRAVATV